MPSKRATRRDKNAPIAHPPQTPRTTGTRAPDVTSVNQVAQLRAEYHSGPLPSPSVLAGYNEIIPDGADRILRMAEEQQRHRMILERTVIQGDSRRATWGVAAGFTVSMFTVGVAAFLISTGHEVTGTIIGTLDIVALAGTFVYGTKSRRDERRVKARLQGPDRPDK